MRHRAREGYVRRTGWNVQDDARWILLDFIRLYRVGRNRTLPLRTTGWTEVTMSVISFSLLLWVYGD